MVVSVASQAARRLTEEAAHWHALQRMQPLDADQQARFMEWLTASPAHVREYLAVTRVAGALGEALDAMALDVEALLQAERQRDTGPARNVVALPLPPRRPVAAGGTARSRSAARRSHWHVGLAAMLGLLTVLGAGPGRAPRPMRRHMANNAACNWPTAAWCSSMQTRASRPP